MLNTSPDDHDTVHDIVLDPIRHARLIADMERVCVTANIPPKMLRTSAKGFCSPAEIDWITHFPAYRQQQLGGLVLHGVQSIAVDKKMTAIGGALLRNYTDARLMTLHQVLDTADDGTPLIPTVLLVPNVYVEATGKSLPAWQIQVLYDVLLGRLAANKPSVLYVENMEGVATVYGPPFLQHLQQHYHVLADGQPVGKRRR